MKRTVVKIASKLVWFKKSFLALKYQPLDDTSQIFVAEFIPFSVLS